MSHVKRAVCNKITPGVFYYTEGGIKIQRKNAHVTSTVHLSTECIEHICEHMGDL